MLRAIKFAPAALLLMIGSSRAEDHRLTIQNFMFMPMVLTIKAGDTVIWDNKDGEPHTVVNLDHEFRSPALDEKDTFSHTFKTPGTFKYFCSIHPKMVGTIIVTPK
jgi:plastocyanin